MSSIPTSTLYTSRNRVNTKGTVALNAGQISTLMTEFYYDFCVQ